MTQGSLHPITLYLRHAIAIFTKMGFEVVDSPEITTEQHNFDDLLIPPDHPARRMFDQFYLKDGRLPRAHTSAYQIPAMKTRKPPVRCVIPGRVFRNEATDATHEIMFNQLEGFVIDHDINLANLKATLTTLVHELCGSDTQIRFQPSYFPFVEPGLELWAKLGSRWIEMGGAGMIHPGVLKNMGLDPQHYQGFAFGVGDRLVMLRHGIDDIRHFYSGNLRFLKQFRVSDTARSEEL